VRGGGDRSADGDVWQRRKVRDRQPVRGKRTPEIAVADACFHHDGLRSDLDDLIQVLGRKEEARRVGDATERMARPERPEQIGLRHNLLRLGDRARREHAVG
jgi:hypothetical protein